MAARDPKNSSFCHIYMTAVADSLAFMRGVLKDNFPICVTGNVTSRQLGDVVIKYIRDNPRDRHLNAPRPSRPSRSRMLGHATNGTG
jgi:Rap1a immunity proteins